MDILILSVIAILSICIAVLCGEIIKQMMKIRKSMSIRKKAREKGQFLYSKNFEMSISDVPYVSVKTDEGGENTSDEIKEVKKDSKIRTALFGKRKYLVSENGGEVVEVEPSPYWNSIDGSIAFRKEVIYYKKKEVVVWTSEDKQAEKLVKITELDRKKKKKAKEAESKKNESKQEESVA